MSQPLCIRRDADRRVVMAGAFRSGVRGWRFLIGITLLVAMWPMAGCGGGGERSENGRAQQGGDAVLSTRHFDTWQAFLEARPPAESSPNRVVFIGIDGAAWNVIDPMIAEGILPAFERLKREGRYGTLRSTSCYMSPPAWAALTTGYLPESSGIYTFGKWIKDEQRFRAVSADDFRKPSLWDVASKAGRRTGVVNVPLTYPVRPVNGIMLSGLLTPVKVDDRERLVVLRFEPSDEAPPGVPASSSPVLSSTLDYEGNHLVYRLVDTTDDGEVSYDRVHLTMTAGEGSEPTVYQFPFGQYSDWVKILFQSSPGHKTGWSKLGVLPGRRPSEYMAYFSRVMFSYTDATIPFAHPPALIDDMSERFPHYFPSTYMDGPIVPTLTQESAERAMYLYDYDDWDLYFYVFTQTDNIHHAEGMTPNTKVVYRLIDRFLGQLMDRLPPDCTLIVASDHGFKSYEYNIDLNRLLESMGLLHFAGDGSGDLDFDRTLVFHNLWHLYYNDELLNRETLTEYDIPCPEDVMPREALTSYLRQAIPEVLSQDYAANVAVELTPVAQTDDSDPHVAVTGTYGEYKIEFWNFLKLSERAVERLEEYRWFHTRDGVYMVWGNGVSGAGHGGEHDIQDIAPTIQYLLGVPTAPDVDGHIMTSILEAGLLEGLDRYIVEAYDWGDWRAIATDTDRDNLEKKLRSLGYIR